MTGVVKRGWEKIFVFSFIFKHELGLTMEALFKAKRLLQGLYRKDGRDAFVHVYKVAQILIFFGILNDVVLAAGFLHDILEDISDATVDILSKIFPEEVLSSEDIFEAILNILSKIFPEEVLSLVIVLTKTDGMPLITYFARISKKPLAVLIKLADRLHNLRNMIKNLGKYHWSRPEKLREQVEETKLYVLRLANQAIAHEKKYPNGCPVEYFSVMLKMTDMLREEVRLAEAILGGMET